MLKKQNKVIALLVAMVFCLSLVAVAPPQAAAASTYSVIKTQTVSAINTYLDTPRIVIEVPDAAALSNGDILTIHLPKGLEMDNVPAWDSSNSKALNPRVVFKTETGNFDTCLMVVGTTTRIVTGDDIQYNFDSPKRGPNVRVYAPASVSGNAADRNALDGTGAFAAYAVGNSAIEIKITKDNLSGAGKLYVDLVNVKVTQTFDGDIVATMYAPSSSGFSSGAVVIAKYLSAGKGTVAAAKSVVSMGSAGATLDTLFIQETVKNSIETSEVIKFKLPTGFTWDTSKIAVTPGWAFSGKTFSVGTADDGRTLTITAPSSGMGGLSSEGRIYIAGAAVNVDDATAKTGEVKVRVFSDKGNVTEQEITVANYVEYAVSVEGVKSVEVVGGKDDTELGSFRIKEAIAGSILPNRTIVLTLPDGVEWDDMNYAAATVTSRTMDAGSDLFTAAGTSVGVNPSNKRVLKVTLGPGPFSKTNMVVEKLKTRISPAFEGDVYVDVSGTAGVSGKVKVATVKKPVQLSVSAVKQVVIGKQDQPVGDIVIAENAKEAIDAKAGSNKIRLELPNGVTFSKVPKASVDGDISLDSVTLTTDNRFLDITTKGTSSAPSKIILSDVYLNVDRTVPEGALKLAIDAAASTALQNTVPNLFTVDNMAEVELAQVVTPAPAEQGRNASFFIGSTVMTVNGSNIIMDAAPYIKNGRTYVPVRYLGDALGATTSWDAATQTVTVTKGNKTVVLVIGSKIAKVNGQDVVMDVAPEISNGRTMLPARYVAEGLGYQVGWNPALKQVVIQ
jgi:hypothetical protein